MKFKTKDDIRAIVKDLMGNLAESHPGVTASLDDIKEIAQEVLLEKYREDIRLRVEDLFPNELDWLLKEIDELKKGAKVGGKTTRKKKDKRKGKK